MQLAADLSAGPFARVHVGIGHALAYGRGDLRERTRFDTLARCRWRPDHGTGADDLLRGDDPGDLARSGRAGLRAGGAVPQVAAKDEADTPVDALLAEV